MFTPRDYQDIAYQRCGKILGAGGNPLAIMATGSGKTHVAGMLCEKMLPKGRRALFLAHRGFLLDQADQKILQHTGIHPHREQAGQTADWGKHPFITGSVQTLQNGRLAQIPKDAVHYIFVDECHRSVAPTYQNIFDHFDKAQRIGLTATADRPDNKPLFPIFSEIAIQYSLSKAIRDSHLCRIIGRKVRNFEIDLSEIRVAGNDYSDDDVAHIIEEYLVPISHNVVKETKDRKKVLMFMPDVESSMLIAETMEKMGYAAEYVSGERNDNDVVLAKFHSGEIKYLASCMLLVEGYDEPAIDCVVMLRPTLSRIVFSQGVGRGTRKHEDKENLLLLEFTYNSNKHKLVTAYELMGETLSTRIVDEAEKNDHQDVDFITALEEAHESHFSIAGIVARACTSEYDFQSFNPLEIGDLVDADLDSGTKAWFEGKELKGSITGKQDELLHRYMIKTENMTKAQASSLISALQKDKYAFMRGESSLPQLNYLRSLYPGQHFPENMTKAAASLLITATKKGVNKEWIETI